MRESVRKTLKARGLSQKEFAEKYGISDSWLNKFLCGVHNPRYDSLEKLQNAVDKEVLDEGRPS